MMSLRATVSARLVLSACLAGSLLAQASNSRADEAALPDPLMHQALAAYEVNHWQKSFAAMGALADAGHADAARVALLMTRHGSALFRERFEVTPARRLQWLETAVRAQGVTRLAANADTK